MLFGLRLVCLLQTQDEKEEKEMVNRFDTNSFTRVYREEGKSLRVKLHVMPLN